MAAGTAKRSPIAARMRGEHSVVKAICPEGEATGDRADDDRCDRSRTAVIGGKACAGASELCGVPPYVAHRQIDVYPSPNRRLVRHILARLQRAQESHDIWLAGPASSRPSCSPSRQCRQCSLFRSKVSLGVDVGGIERHVSEPSTDRIDIDARLKEMGGGRMANDVGTDPFSLQR